jgi:hypothetical protein
MAGVGSVLAQDLVVELLHFATLSLNRDALRAARSSIRLSRELSAIGRDRRVFAGMRG